MLKKNKFTHIVVKIDVDDYSKFIDHLFILSNR